MLERLVTTHKKRYNVENHGKKIQNKYTHRIRENDIWIILFWFKDRMIVANETLFYK